MAASKFMIGTTIAIPAASLCINRRLYYIACIRVVTTTKADRLRGIMVDLAIGVGLPVLIMILRMCLNFPGTLYIFLTSLADTIPQGHRFNIYEDLGCLPDTYSVWPIYPILYLPVILIGLTSGTYAIMTIITLGKNLSQFKSLLPGNPNINSNRIIRLMCLASLDILFTLPFCSWAIYLQAQTPLQPWISWAWVHLDFYVVDQIPALIWRSTALSEADLESNRWIVVVCAFLFFAFFGFADEARKNYRTAFQSVAKRVGMSTSSFGNSATSSDFLGTYVSFILQTIFPSLTYIYSYRMKSKIIGSSGKVRPVIPLFVHQDMLRRHDSMDSFDMSIGDVSGALSEKSDLEKQDFSSTLSYGALSIADVGGALEDTKDNALSTRMSSVSDSTIACPPPARTRRNSRDGTEIEISSVRRDSSYIEPTNSLAVPTIHHSQ